jgi:3-phosphoglycerate kinase
MKNIKDLNIDGRTVLIRFDYNVPIENNTIMNDFRIKSSFKTIDYCLSKGASIVIMSHLGRPEGKDKKFTLKPVYDYLKKYYKKKILFSNDCISEESIEISKKLKPGEIHMLENLRFYDEERNNDDIFSKKLSKHADIYVCDSFGISHREHSSNSKILKYFKIKGIGFIITKELQYLRINESSGMGVIIGGAKISTKIKMINHFLDNSDVIFIGGAMLFTFLKSQKINIGLSKVEDNMLDLAVDIIEKAKKMNKKILFPLDLVCVKDTINSNKIFIKEVNNLDDNDIGLDIGPETVKLFMKYIKNLNTIIWNGPLGYFENKNFCNGTIEISRYLKKIKNTCTIIGGGDTISAIEMYDNIRGYTHVSTGGGASLKLLSGEKLNLTKSWDLYSNE